MGTRMRVLFIALLLCATFLLSGCVDVFYQVQVDEGGSGTVRVLAAYNPEQLASFLEASETTTDQALVSDDVRRKATAARLFIDEVGSGNQQAVRVSGAFATPEELPETLDRIESVFRSMEIAKTLTALGVAPTLDATLTVEAKPFSTQYALSLYPGTSAEDSAAASMEALMPTRIDYAAVARMPGETLTTNGTYQPADDSTAWQPDPENPEQGDYEIVTRTVNWRRIGLIGGGGALLLAVAFVLLLRSRRRASA